MRGQVLNLPRPILNLTLRIPEPEAFLKLKPHALYRSARMPEHCDLAAEANPSWWSCYAKSTWVFTLYHISSVSMRSTYRVDVDRPLVLEVEAPYEILAAMLCDAVKTCCPRAAMSDMLGSSM